MTYLDYFKELCKIPHGSGNTTLICDYLERFAKEHSLEYHRDDVNNIIIIKEASLGRENDEPVIIQGHMDMVAVKDDDIDKDMKTEGLDVEIDGDFMFAKGTSLGGDDGIAVAYALAILDSDMSLPRIEAVFTVDEEVGMEGATAIDVSPLKGHTFLNVDSEEEGEFLVSCAGGARVDLSYDCNTEARVNPASGNVTYEISISDFIGGHSGTEIDKNRANAIRIMCKILKKLFDAGVLLGLGDFSGGTADNAICASAKTVVLCKPIEPELFDMIKYEAMDRYMQTEKNAKISYRSVDLQIPFYQAGDFLHFLTSLPDGVMAMSKDIEGLVETSLNHGIISMENGVVKLSLSIRSNIDSEKENLKKTIKELVDNRPVKMNVHGDYPGWAYRENSPIRDKMVNTYREMYGKEPIVKALHAGLECGIFASKIPDLDCVSFGPNIYDIHTTREHLSLSSAERTWDFIVKILSK